MKPLDHEEQEILESSAMATQTKDQRINIRLTREDQDT
jgi:predicted DNA binding CopG/RHH family protein